jgi:predicted transcriptional regulator
MEASYDALRALTSSKLRWGILDSLEKPRRLSDLRRIVGANAPNTSTKAKDLQRLGLIERDNGDFKLTHSGRIIHKRLSLLADTMDSLYKHVEFWSKILDKLPPELLCEVHTFKNARIIKNSRDDLHKVEREVLHFVNKAEGRLLVILPVTSKELISAITEISKKVETTLVTLHENPNLRYGLISSDKGTMLFTEMLDMALVKKALKRSGPQETLQGAWGTKTVALYEPTNGSGPGPGRVVV